jgi:transposase
MYSNYTKTLFIGADVGLDTVDICYLDFMGNKLNSKRLVYPNNLPGSQELTDHVFQTMEKNGLEAIMFGIEATSFLGWHLEVAILDSPILWKFKPSVFCFNPAQVKAHKKALGNLPKSDPIDAFAVADRLRCGKLPKPAAFNFPYIALQRLTRLRYHLADYMAREKNIFLSVLFLKFSSFRQSDIFSNTFGAASLAVINDFLTVDEIAARPLDDLIDFLMDKGKAHFTDPADTAKKLKDASTKAYRLHSDLHKPVNFALKTTAENIKFYSKQMAIVDKQITKQVQAFDNPLLSIKGIGPVFSAGLIAEIGDIARFTDDNALAKYSGLTWNFSKSGRNQNADDTFITHTGDSYLRYYFTESANLVRQLVPEYIAYYQQKYNESKTHKHRRALVFTARKLVRLVFALLRDNKNYSPNFRRCS